MTIGAFVSSFSRSVFLSLFLSYFLSLRPSESRSGNTQQKKSENDSFPFFFVCVSRHTNSDEALHGFGPLCGRWRVICR